MAATRPETPIRLRTIVAAGLFCGALACAGPALAQLQTPPSPPPVAPPPTTTVPEKIAPPLQDDMTGTTLSDKLNRSDGVIKPPAGVDPEIHAPVPEGQTGRMPVIPPPGTPGGTPNVDPK
ncbi:MAG: hypothetical protein U1E62_17895 [Alsobacter sp.]